MTDASKSADAATKQMMSLFEEWQKAGLGAFAWSNPDWFQAVSDINAEVARFVSDRLREDMQFQAELMKCRDPAAVREVYTRYMKSAFEQYSAQTGKLTDMNRAALDALVGRLSKG